MQWFHVKQQSVQMLHSTTATERPLNLGACVMD